MNDFIYNNEDEGDMGQLHSIHVHLNAIARVQRSMGSGPARDTCSDCADKIPLLRQQAVPGCMRCIVCQAAYEHQKVLDN